MSGIAGVVRVDGGPPSRTDLDRAVNALRAHGPDRSGIRVHLNVGLANVLMRITSDDFVDHQPTVGATGAIITADVRLDNRTAILNKLNLGAAEWAGWSDSRIILAGWERFGDQLWRELRGPFSVAIWDPRDSTLTLARDHLGLNSLFWSLNASLFAFATTPNALFAVSQAPRVLNDEKFADFLVLNHKDQRATVYKDVFRVEPGRLLKIGRSGSITNLTYWSLADVPTIRLASDSAYADELRHRLQEAVRRQIRSAYPVGCYLSGGLDSSSIAILAAETLANTNDRLTSFTQVPRRGFDGPVPKGFYADERPFVEAIQKMAGNIDAVYVENDSCDDFAEHDAFLNFFEGPVRNLTHIGWMLCVARAARAKGIRVLLTGLFGNSTISWSGWSQTFNHLLHGKMRTAVRQANLYFNLTNYSWKETRRRLFVEPLKVEIERRFAGGSLNSRIAPWATYSAINPAFASETGVVRRASEFAHDFQHRLHRNERLEGLYRADYFGDWFAAQRALTGVELRCPAADIDVVEYCFGIPPEQYLAEGTDRSIIRRAMWGLLPREVLTNRLTGLQSADWFEKLGAKRELIEAEIRQLSRSPNARKTIDVERLAQATRGWPVDGWARQKIISEYNYALTRGIAAGRFLQWLDSRNDETLT